MASGALSSITDVFESYELNDASDTASASANSTVYGRSLERNTLLETYQRLLDTKETQAVIVHGESGSGKTVLVDTLRNPVFDSKGYFVGGKYFQNVAVQEPYSAIMAAFSDLCDLVAQSEDFDVKRRKETASALSEHAQLLVKAISSLSRLIGEVNEFEMEASFAKFKVACKAFLLTMSSNEHPVVLFLDDIQWADSGSEEVIRFLLQDSELKNVMFIFTYRDEDAAIVEQVLENTGDMTEITLSNLDTTAVRQMIASITGTSSDEVGQLSELVVKRTSGNPLYVSMVLETIQQEGLLAYDNEASCWIFDVAHLRQTIMVSETLADLLTRKIERLSNAVKETLKVASILGYSFEESRLLMVFSKYLQERKLTGIDDHMVESRGQKACQTSVVASLAEALEVGFIERTANNGYQFTHDRLQSSFRSLVGQFEEDRLHLIIGEAFLVGSDEERKYNFYKAAVHLNCAPGFLYEPSQHVKLARINLDAAKYCEEVSAFEKAATVLRKGLDVLSAVEQWSEAICPLTFEIMKKMARTQLIVGNFEGCKDIIQTALLHATSSEMKTQFLLIEVEVRMAGNEVDDALITASRALASLGVKVPRKARLHHVIVKLIKIKFMLRNKTDSDILNLPVTQDPLAANAARLLMHVCTYCMVKDEPETAMFSALLAIELTLIHGLSHHSPVAFTIYGIAETMMGNTDRAYRFVRLALVMLDRMQSRESTCPTMVYALTMVTYLKEPFVDLVDPLYHAAGSGFQYGDILYATFCALQSFVMQIHLGRNCAYIESLMRVTYARVSDLGQYSLLLWLQPPLQYLLNMQSSDSMWDFMHILSGDIMGEEAYLHQTLSTNNNMQATIVLLWKSKLAVEFGGGKKYGMDTARWSFGGPSYLFLQARAHFGIFESSGRSGNLGKARRYMRLLQKMVDNGCPDAAPLCAFLVAQEATLRKRRAIDESVLRTAYQRGIDHFVKSKSCDLEGMLSERAGFDFAERGLNAEAERYFSRALFLFKNEWGATAKHNQLRHDSARALGVSTGLPGTCIVTAQPLEALEVE
jgi:histidine kinase